MSERRKIGERVFVVPGASFGASKGVWATIIDWPTNQPEEQFPCLLDCGDDDCMEFGDLETDNGQMLHHVSECEMRSEK